MHDSTCSRMTAGASRQCAVDGACGYPLSMEDCVLPGEPSKGSLESRRHFVLDKRANGHLIQAACCH